LCASPRPPILKTLAASISSAASIEGFRPQNSSEQKEAKEMKFGYS